MMPRSLSHRIQRNFFWIYTISVVVVLVVAWIALEDLELVMMESDQSAELEHFRDRAEPDKVINAHSALIILSYQPHALKTPDALPSIFEGLPVPYHDETEFLGKEYLVTIEPLTHGTFYLAKDLSPFEQRETLFSAGLVFLGILAIVLGFGLSRWLGQMISQPVARLSADIVRNSRSGQSTPLSEAYAETELNQITEAFNHYMDRLNDMVERERSLISMASHELRTPISIILGAAEVMQQRQRLKPEDQKTLQRIATAATTMSDNVQALLSLVRQQKHDLVVADCDLAHLIQKVVSDIGSAHPDQSQRIVVSVPSQPRHYSTNAALARMLINNLIINALQHNSGMVSIGLHDNVLSVTDAPDQSVLNRLSQNLTSANNSSSGLGLFIVNLICDRLGWHFQLTSRGPLSTEAKVTLLSNHTDRD